MKASPKTSLKKQIASSSCRFRCLVAACSLLLLPANAEHPDVRKAGQQMTRAMQQRNASLALDEANKIVGKRPKDPDALVLRAKLFMMMREGDQAMADINAALALDPHHPSSTQIMANHEFQQGKKEKAEARVDAALKKYPRSIEMIVMKADLLKAAGKQAEANKRLNRGWEVVATDEAIPAEHKAMLLAKLAESDAGMGRSELAGKRFLEAAGMNRNHLQLYGAAIQQFEKAKQWKSAAEATALGIKAVEKNLLLNANQKKAMIDELKAKAKELAKKVPNQNAGFAKLQEKLDEGWDLEDFLYELKAEHRRNDILGNTFYDDLPPEQRAKKLRNQIRVTPKHWAYIHEQLKKRAESQKATPTELAVEALLDKPGDPELEKAVAKAYLEALQGLEIDQNGSVVVGKRKDGKPRAIPHYEAIIPDHIFVMDQGHSMEWYEKREWRKARLSHQDHPSYPLSQANEKWDDWKASRLLEEKTQIFPSYKDYELLALYAYWKKKYDVAATMAGVASALYCYEKAHTFAPKGLSDYGRHEKRLMAMVKTLGRNAAGEFNFIDQDVEAIRNAALRRRWADMAEPFIRIKKLNNPESKGPLKPDELASLEAALALLNKLTYSKIYEMMVWGILNDAAGARNKGDAEELERYTQMITKDLRPSGQQGADFFVLEQKQAAGELRANDIKFSNLFRANPKHAGGHLLKGQMFERANELKAAQKHYLTAMLCAKGASPAKFNLQAVEKRLGIKTDEQRKQAYMDSLNAILKGGFQTEDAGVVDSLAIALQQMGLGGNSELIRIQALAVGGEHEHASKLANDVVGQILANRKMPRAEQHKKIAQLHAAVGKYSYLNHKGKAEAYKIAAEHYEKAIENCDQPVATNHSGCGMSWHEYAKRSGKGHEQAVKQLSLGIDLGINNASMFIARSKSHEMLGHYNEAADDARKALELYRKTRESLAALPNAGGPAADRYKELQANMKILSASDQLRRVGEKMMLASKDKMDAGMKRMEEIIKENPDALKQLDEAMEKQRQKEQKQGK